MKPNFKFKIFSNINLLILIYWLFLNLKIIHFCPSVTYLSCLESVNIIREQMTDLESNAFIMQLTVEQHKGWGTEP